MLHRGTLVVASKLLFAVERDREKRIHTRNLRKIIARNEPPKGGDSALADSPTRRTKRPGGKRGRKKRFQAPPTGGLLKAIDHVLDKERHQHIRKNAKKADERRTQELLLQKRNKHMSDRLLQINKQDPAQRKGVQNRMELIYLKPRSLNIDARRREILRINRENEYMLERLTRVAPTLSAKGTVRDYRRKKKKRQQLRQFVPTHDIFVHSQTILEEFHGAKAPTRPRAAKPKRFRRGKDARAQRRGRRIVDPAKTGESDRVDKQDPAPAPEVEAEAPTASKEQNVPLSPAGEQVFGIIGSMPRSTLKRCVALDEDFREQLRPVCSKLLKPGRLDGLLDSLYADGAAGANRAVFAALVRSSLTITAMPVVPV